MNIKDFKKILDIVIQSFPNADNYFNDDVVDVWYKKGKTYEFNIISKAIENLVNNAASIYDITIPNFTKCLQEAQTEYNKEKYRNQMNGFDPDEVVLLISFAEENYTQVMFERVKDRELVRNEYGRIIEREFENNFFKNKDLIISHRDTKESPNFTRHEPIYKYSQIINLSYETGYFQKLLGDERKLDSTMQQNFKKIFAELKNEKRITEETEQKLVEALEG